jgi:hypothetical protein
MSPIMIGCTDLQLSIVVRELTVLLFNFLHVPFHCSHSVGVPTKLHPGVVQKMIGLLTLSLQSHGRVVGSGARRVRSSS